MPAREAGDLGVSAVLAGDPAVDRGNLFGGNIDDQFAGALRVQDGPVLMIVAFVIVAFVIVPFMVVSLVLVALVFVACLGRFSCFGFLVDGIG